MKVKGGEITDEDLLDPLTAFVKPDKREVVIADMEDYADVFYAVEYTVMCIWQDDPALEDRDVISAYKKLLKDFDGGEEGSLVDEISKSVKAMLLYRRLDGREDYTHGEIVSCLKFLVNIARQHKSPSGRGYLHWLRVFFEGKLPVTEGEMLDYILRYES